MKKLRPVLLAALAVLLCLSLTACGTSLGENTQIYFTNTSAVISNLFSSGKAASAGKRETADSGKTPLPAPTGLTVDADGNYSFTGVDGAEYYLLYFCSPNATSDDDTFIYSSEPIEDDGSGTYTGHCSEKFQYAFGEYLVKVYAFPDLTDETRSMSTAATASYTYSGAQSAPEISYYWNTFDGTMAVQVANLGAYEFEAYPDQVDVTFTNTENAADMVTVSIQGVSPANSRVSTDALTRGSTYQITAVATSTDQYVTNPTSDVTTVESSLTLGENNLYTGVSYSDGFANNIFNWPIVATSFDLTNGGEAGQAAGMFGFTSFTATPTETSPGSSYSYIISGGSWATGPLELLPDGTFIAEETGGGPVNASTIQGTWVDNGDGTATLNYDHSSVAIN